MSPRRPNAFTLIELLVVVSIIALLVSILLPALGQARTTAKNVQCQTTVRQHSFVALMYAEDHRSFLPPATGFYKGSAFARPWHFFIFGQIDAAFTPGQFDTYPMQCSIAKQGIDGAQTGYSYAISGNMAGLNGLSARVGENTARKRMAQPTNVALFMDSRANLNVTSIGVGQFANLTQRHGTGFNVGFLDGHAGDERDPGFWTAGVYSQYRTNPLFNPRFAQFWGWE